MTKTLSTKPSLQKDVYYATLFNQVTQHSAWLTDKAFAPGGWAVDYCFLYVMYRALKACKPSTIIELGLGQTTHMLSQYKAWYNITSKQQKDDFCHLLTFEHDANWIEFFKTQSLVQLDIYQCELIKDTSAVIDGETYEHINYYSNFSNIAGIGKKYQFVVIDAPFGTKPYSRIHVLELIADDLIDTDHFVIMIDDMNREGEQNTFKKCQEMLKARGVKFKTQIYSGEKEHGIIVSDSLKFLTTM